MYRYLANYFIFYISIILLLSFYSCQNRSKNIDLSLVKFLGTTLIIPQQMEDEYENILHSSKNKLIIIVDPKDCTACALQNINTLKLYREQLSKFNTEVLLFTKGSSKNEVESVLYDMKIEYPVIYYNNDEFIIKNKLTDNPLLHTFVINKEKNVIWIGSPIKNQKSWDLFCKMMRKLKKDS